MTDDKQPWPKPSDIVLMTTKERNEMHRYVNTQAAGVIWRDKLTRAYQAGFKAGRDQDEWKIASGEVK